MLQFDRRSDEGSALLDTPRNKAQLVKREEELLVPMDTEEVFGNTQTTLTVYPRVDVDHRGTTR